MTSRRSVLAYLGALPVGACWSASRIGERGREGMTHFGPTEAGTTTASDGDAMDQALEMLAPYGASYRGGLSNHGPMTAEALVALGRHDAVEAWVERYRRRLEARPARRKPIDGETWREALGDRSRNRDWDEWFSRQLAEGPFAEVVGRWVPRLAPGIAAAGLQGVVRVGHAVCALEVKETALRLDELARALGYWAAEYLTLPGKPSKPGDLAPSQALKSIELLPNERRTGRGLITTELNDLKGFEPFEGAIDLVDPSKGKPSFMTDLVATFAGTFTNTKAHSFVFLHAITGAAAIAELLPYVPVDQRAAVRVRTWQVLAGIYSRFGKRDLLAIVEGDPIKAGVKEMAAQAVATGDEHTIKLVAACTREWARNPDARLLAAAAKRTRRGR